MDPNLKVENSDYKQILVRKLSLAVLSSIAFQLIVLIAYVFILNFSVFSPLDSLLDFIGTVTSLSTWGYFVLFTSTVFAQSVICAKDYVVRRRYSSTRFRKFLALFSVHNVTLLLLHVTVGVTCVWLFLSLAGSERGSLVSRRGEAFYLSEDSFYLYACGGWSGFYYFAALYTPEKKIMFPVIQQRKLLQFKTNFLAVFRESKSSALRPAVYYASAYTIFGTSCASWLSACFGVTFEGARAGPARYVLTWAFATLIFFHLDITKFFYELFLTEPVRFPIVSEGVTLAEAISINVPIIQHLACFDLFELAGHSRIRRDELFALSQPGGHPHSWNKLIEAVLKIIDNFVKALDKSSSTVPKMEQPATPSVRPINYEKLRNMSLYVQNVPSTSPASPVVNPRATRMKEWLTVFKKRSGFDYVFKELPEANVQKCLGDGQVIMWVVQALASVAVVSLKEDRYGIVQKDLPVIMSALVELKASVERLNRTAAPGRRADDDFGAKMRTGVLNAVKRSLFGVCVAFGPYVKDLGLKKEVVVQLQGFFPR